jgi:hypothetical protein
MSPSRLVLAVLLPLVPAIATAQQSSPTQTQAVAFLQQALTALAPTTITDVTLSGTARRIAGSDDESGTAAFKALLGVGSRLDLGLSSGIRTEVRNNSGPIPKGSWSGPDGTVHPITYHNLLTDIGLFPVFTLTGFAHSSSAVINYVGAESHDGQAVQHISASLTPPAPDPPGAPSFAHLTQIDFFLDSTTFLPTAITFSTHPDDNASLDLAVEIRFSNYAAVNGAQIPLHVQKLLNNTLFLDLQFQSAALNTGVAGSEFTVE